MYELVFEKRVKKDFKNINISDIHFIKDTLTDFVKNFAYDFELLLIKSGKIKKMTSSPT